MKVDFTQLGVVVHLISPGTLRKQDRVKVILGYHTGSIQASLGRCEVFCTCAAFIG